MSTDNTLSEQDKLDQTMTTEQRTMPDLVNQDQRVEPVAGAEDPTPPTPEKKDEEPPVDPRAARMDRLAERAHERNTEELEQAREAVVDIVRPEPEVKPEPAPERMMKIKVRGQEVEMPESEVIARAQKVDAADSYLTEARGLLDEAKRTTRREPEPAPKREEPQPTPEKVDRIAQAIEQIQLGGDPAEARALLDTEFNERARSAARDAINEDRQHGAVASFDDQVDAGYALFDKESPEVAADPVARAVVTTVAGQLEAAVIAKFLTEAASPEIRSAFESAGITAEGLRTYSPQDAHALYKDMALKGYPLPKPAVVIQAAGKTVAERFASTTQVRTAPAPKPGPTLDRTVRKEAISQPERTAIPRPTGATPPPKAEGERSQGARTDMRSERRTGAPRR